MFSKLSHIFFLFLLLSCGNSTSQKRNINKKSTTAPAESTANTNTANTNTANTNTANESNQSDGSENIGTKTTVGNNISEDQNQAESETNTGETDTNQMTNSPLHFSLKFIMTKQNPTCSGCGILFTWTDDSSKKPLLKIEYSLNGERKELSIQHQDNTVENAYSTDNSQKKQHVMLVKKSPRSDGYFYADIGAIPKDANIEKVSLYMQLDHKEGLAWGDDISYIDVYEYLKSWKFGDNFDDNSQGNLIRRIENKKDFFDRQYNKSHPWGSHDFTEYVKELQQKR